MLTELDDLVKLHKVNKHEILKFLQRLVLPAVSYGAYTDSENAREHYLSIDEDIINYVHELFN